MRSSREPEHAWSRVTFFSVRYRRLGAYLPVSNLMLIANRIEHILWRPARPVSSHQ